jgi:hypothetical protein
VLALELRQITDFDPTNLRMAGSPAIYREQSHPIIVEGEPIEDKWIVRGQQSLSPTIQARFDEDAGEASGGPRVERLVKVIDREEVWRLRIECEHERE